MLKIPIIDWYPLPSRGLPADTELLVITTDGTIFTGVWNPTNNWHVYTGAGLVKPDMPLTHFSPLPAGPGTHPQEIEAILMEQPDNTKELGAYIIAAGLSANWQLEKIPELAVNMANEIHEIMNPK